YPERLLLSDGNKSATVVESSNIHEGVLSPDGKRVAFARQPEGQDKAEIWIANAAKRTRKKLATVPSCFTLLFSRQGDRLFFQEKPKDNQSESGLWTLSAGGGKPKLIGSVRLLQTLVEKGRYQGDLVVYRLSKHHLGTAMQECPFLLDPSGREMGRIKDVA